MGPVTLSCASATSTETSVAVRGPFFCGRWAIAAWSDYLKQFLCPILSLVATSGNQLQHRFEGFLKCRPLENQAQGVEWLTDSKDRLFFLKSTVLYKADTKYMPIPTHAKVGKIGELHWQLLFQIN
ncbi:hypothetical protein VFPPC_18201 [Pochonia chlamydosporia 170]|uniref:Uncharacterized protein n=1 Tax=Pochonia chlamydosporia 170 TaxID=1380566 RepID=A0A219APL1_METCM|nr:hypothetical protein VFPPC_18201 [Pochonia chlamydosporia 170]OWT42641.1 hypothetical protein VFPPC_18201 [Pochonia chlamydosporia 170]